jgi:hypothetical protein
LRKKKSFHRILSYALIFCLLFTAMPIPASYAAQSNLAEGKAVTPSSQASPYLASNLVDGKKTDTSQGAFWKAQDSDGNNDHKVHVEIDLGENAQISKIVLIGLNERNSGAKIIENFKVSGRVDGGQDVEFFNKPSEVSKQEEITLDSPVTARIVRFDFEFDETLTKNFYVLREIEIYGTVITDGDEPGDGEPGDGDPLPGDGNPLEPVTPPAEHSNLTSSTTLKSSSNCGSCEDRKRDNLYDGSTDTFYGPTSWDIADKYGENGTNPPDQDYHFYIEADLKADTTLSVINLKNVSDKVTSYDLSLTKAGESSPFKTVTRNTTINTVVENVYFNPFVNAQKVRVDFFVDPNADYSGKFFLLSELEIFGKGSSAQPPVEEPKEPPAPPKTVVQSVYFLSGDQKIEHDQWLKLAVGDTLQISPRVELSTGSVAPASDKVVFETHKMTDAITVNSNGMITVVSEAISYVDAKISVDGLTNPVNARLWIDSLGDGVDPSTLNLALKKPVVASSFCGNTCNAPTGTYDYYANDGDARRYWRALSGDYNDDRQAWIYIDLGKQTTFNKAIMNISNVDVSHYELLVSNDAVHWKEVYATKFLMARENTALFQEETARYIKFNAHLKAASKPLLYEIEVYHTDEAPVPPMTNGIKEFFLVDGSQKKYNYKEDVLAAHPQQLKLQTGFVMFDETNQDLSQVQLSFESERPEVATIDNEGHIQTVSRGVSLITATAVYGPQTLTAKVLLVVEDPTVYYATTTLVHDRLVTKIGDPAVLQSGEQKAPVARITAHVNLKADIELLKGTETLQTISAMELQAGSTVDIPFQLALSDGQYKVVFKLETEQQEVWYDYLHFTIQDSAAISASGESMIAYPGADGKMIYVPDYKGNQIIDFSNSGYKGGGVKLPDVKAAIVVKPGEGDDTARIQQAIDFVSSLPIGSDGFRGAIVLDKGTFEVGKSLKVEASGIVIRGKGNGDDGTIIHSTSTEQGSIIQVSDSAIAPVLLEDTKTSITELYVPTGARTFYVKDASNFKVGDSIMVRRWGNSSWIHEIHMDVILEYDPGIVQWEPFEILMDRVITHIEGNKITIDAPVVNAIELMWGGGEVVKYDDSERLENVGFENLKVTTVFDPTIKQVQNGKEYFADEDHAWTFVSLNNVKNAWVRNIHAKHLANSLAYTGRSSKWVTLQDNVMDEHVSVITGSRRYSYYYAGQLALGQRLAADSARHAFTYNSRVAGPNVFLDSVSTTNYNRSEPHHRYSIGGLFDNVHGRLNVMDRGRYGTGHGWAGANYVMWNVTDELTVQRPPTATNYSIGFVGNVLPGDFQKIEVGSDAGQMREDGYFEHTGRHVNTTSLYKAQLADRLGAEALKNILPTPVGGEELDEPQYSEIPENPGEENPGEDSDDDTSTTSPDQGSIESLLQVATDNQGKKTAMAKVTNEQALKALANGKIALGQQAASADKVLMELPAAAIQSKSDIVLQIEGGISDYRLPLSVLNMQHISTSLGVPLNKVQLVLEIAKVDQAEASKWNRSGMKSLSSFISFNLYAKSDDKTLPINHFGNQYVERVIPIEDANFSPENSVGAMVDPVTGNLSFVPTTFEERDGKWYAILKRNSNSIYTVVEYRKLFDDIAGHWAAQDIEHMSSKLLLNGVTESSFNPDGQITRVQFIAMLVRGLGLSGSTAEQSGFADVAKSAWYSSDVAAAAAAGLIAGYEDNTLRPNQRVTRSEMVSMLHRAILFADPKFADVSASGALSSFNDRQDIPAWAADSAAALVQKGIVKGKQPGFFAGGETATRAEAAVTVHRALKQLGFLNKK